MFWLPFRIHSVSQYFFNLVRMFSMGGFRKPEPTLSGTCCAGLILYRPIGKFRVNGRI